MNTIPNKPVEVGRQKKESGSGQERRQRWRREEAWPLNPLVGDGPRSCPSAWLLNHEGRCYANGDSAWARPLSPKVCLCPGSSGEKSGVAREDKAPPKSGSKQGSPNKSMKPRMAVLSPKSKMHKAKAIQAALRESLSQAGRIKTDMFCLTPVAPLIPQI